jgi:hypothetical protein
MMTRMTPSLALILPFFIVFKTLALIDTRTALVIAYCGLILPLSTWMMKSYFDGMPPNIERAGLVDGCTRFQMIRKIVLPLARPGLVAAGIFCFLVSWKRVHLRIDLDQHAAGQDHSGDHRRIFGAAPLLRLRADVRGQRHGRAAACRDHARLPALLGARHALGLAQRVGALGWRA